jgi:predicted ester cyclase
VWKGTHSAIAYGVPATGNQVSTQGSSIYRVENGKIIEGWVVEDVLGLMQQLGAIQTR